MNAAATRNTTRKRPRIATRSGRFHAVQARQYVESNRGVDADVVACAIEGGIACVNLTMIRGGRHVGDRSFFPSNAEGGKPPARWWPRFSSSIISISRCQRWS